MAHIVSPYFEQYENYPTRFNGPVYTRPMTRRLQGGDFVRNPVFVNEQDGFRGLGASGGGILSGDEAGGIFGRNVFEHRGVGMDLGEVAVPDGCWDNPALSSCQAGVYSSVQSWDTDTLRNSYRNLTGQDAGPATADYMQSTIIDILFKRDCVNKICTASAKKTMEDEDYGPWDDSKSDSCTGSAAIKRVQSNIGVTADGIWGPKSNAALIAKGWSFQNAAGGCSGNPPQGARSTGQMKTDVAPYVAPSGGNTGGKTAPKPGTAPPQPKVPTRVLPGSTKASMFTNPWVIGGAAVILLGVLAWYAMDEPKPERRSEITPPSHQLTANRKRGRKNGRRRSRRSRR